MGSPGGRAVVVVAVAAAAIGAALWLRGGDRAATAERAPSARAATSTPGAGGAAPLSSSVKSAPAATSTTATAAVAATGEVVVRAGWGGGAGQAGRRRDPESNPEAPMAIAPLADGTTAVLDQVNRRVVRWRDGKPVGTIALGGDTAQDVAAAAGGRTAVLDRLGDRVVQLYGADGQLENSIDLRAAVGDPGTVTGLFADDDGVYVERDHRELVRVADANGRSLRGAGANEGARLGRPSRDGKWLVTVEIADRASGQVAIRGVDRKLSAGAPTAFEGAIALGGPILHIVALDSDRAGNLVVAATVGEGADEALVVARVRPSAPGVVAAGTLRLPPLVGADETFRPVALDDAGAVYVSYAENDGLVVRRYAFP